MKIKRLEIQGFKSFADRTLIDFKEGITGIVGPNGCGKSNIVDAIRWVMGEMSAKHLRGREMQDVIFAGSDKRSPGGMSEVTLILSNEDGRAPATYAHFSEISVTRRLFRSGESEYFINKVSCRLRDIYDLFLGTGVGTKAYSIVEQGQIGLIISSKPENRRQLIEEAAGISKFKARKEAALRKIEATKGNLTRLDDILKELKRQINSLDRQAKKAAKYKELREEAKTIDLHLSSLDYTFLNHEINEGEKNANQLTESEAESSAHLAKIENEIETSRLQMNQEEQELSQVQERLYEKNNSVSLHEQGIQYKKREILQLTEREATALLEIEETKEKNQTNEVEIEETQKSQIEINEKLLSSEERFRTFRKQVDDEEKKQRDLDLAIEKTQQEILRLVQSLSESASKQEFIGQQKIEIKGKIAKDSTEIEEIDRLLNQYISKKNEFEKSLNELSQLKLNLSDQSGNIENNLKEEKINFEKIKTDLFHFKEDLSLKRSRLASLVEIQKNFEGYQEGVRRVMLRKQSDQQFDPIYGTVADLIETESTYQKAVGAVLGEKLQYIVVKSQEVGLQAVEYLKTESAGRSSFVPMEVRSDIFESETASAEEGVLGPLKNFVQVKEDYQMVGDYLFQDVLLIETLNRAIQVWNAAPLKKTLVTLEGEVVDAHGVVSGGSPENQSLSILEKKREIKELEITTHRLEQELFQKEILLKESERKIESLVSSLDALKRDAHSEELKLVNIQKDSSHLKGEIARLQSNRDRLNREMTQLATSEQNLENNLAEWISKTTLWQNEKTEKENYLNQIKQDWLSHRQELDQLKELFTKQKIESETYFQTKEQIEKNLRRLLDLQRSYQFKQQEAHRTITQANQTREELKKQILESEEALKILLEEITQLNQRNVALRESYDKHISELREKEIEVKTVRKQNDEMKLNLNQLLIQLTEWRGKLKSLKEQIFERYHTDLSLVVDEYKEKPLEDRAAKESELQILREKLEKLGEVNVGAISEFEEVQTRHDFLNRQSEDLKNSLDSLTRVIQKINRSTKIRFQETFEAVNQKFQELFPKLFIGGRAKLMLTDEENLLETGVEIVAQPHGKKLQSISLLSGGEKALTATCLIFAIFLFKPSPFCLLDEVDAPLDDANIDRFNEMVKSMTERSQFILITHNKRTMEMANVLYGITMEEPGVSKTVSVKLN